MRFLLRLLLALGALAALRRLLRGTTGGPGGSGTSGGGTVPPPPNKPPRLRWSTPVSSPSGVPVPLRYIVEDDESDPVHITVEYSLDGGQTFMPASEDPQVASDGTSALASSPAGAAHVFAWDAKLDLATPTPTAVVVRIASFDANPGGVIVSPPFDVDTRVIAMPSLPWINPFAPMLTGANVPVRFVVGDRDSTPVQVRVECASGTSGWKPATPSLASDRLDSVPAPSIEADYRFIWDAARDFPGQKAQASLRFTAVKSAVSGKPVETGPFSIDTTAPTAPAVFVPPPAIGTPTLKIIGTNPIDGMAGKLLPETLRVQLLDGQGQPRAATRVGFVRTAASVECDFEPDRYDWETTDRFGYAGVRVRVAKGATGLGEIIAALPGFPSVRAKLTFTSHVPAIYHYGMPAGPLLHGQYYVLTIGYGDPQKLWFMPEKHRPIRLRIEATNAAVTFAEVAIPEYTSGRAERTIAFVPRYAAGAQGKLRISDIDDPTVPAVEIPFAIDSTTVSKRTGRFARTDLGLRLEPLAGTSPLQVGYSGLTLDQAFKVKLSDGSALPYDLEALDNFTGCNVTPNPNHPLPVRYSSNDGLLFTKNTPAGTATNVLPALVTDEVFFTPKGDGPWYITASVNEEVVDPNPIPINYVVGGQAVCKRENSLHASLSFTFIVQKAADVRFVHANAPQPVALDKLQAGDAVILEVNGLSKVSAGATADSPSLSTLLASDAAPPAYIGYSPPFDQKIALTLNSGRDGLKSNPITIVQGTPPSAPALPHAVIPGGWLRVHDRGLDVTLPIPGRIYRRFATGDVESLDENPQGSSPATGALNSVLVHNGEFVYQAMCLDFVDRPRPISFWRTHRAHVRTDGVLGPGWDFEHTGGLDVSRGDGGVRWFTGLGRTIDFRELKAPAGIFLRVAANTSITADDSAWTIEDPHGNKIHFDVDGSLRFLIDPSGNRVRYDYNDLGQLERVRGQYSSGSWSNKCELAYWKEVDPVDPATYGKLRSITDHVGRSIEFEFYPAGSADGRPGWLKTVKYSNLMLTDMLVDGQPVAGFANPETYTYEINPKDRLDVKVKTIVDSRSNVRIENHYDTSRRVFEQVTDATGTFKFAYDPLKRSVVATDRKKRDTTFDFTDSPYADAAAPVSIKMDRDQTLHPGAAALVTTYRHTRQGLPASITRASGVIEEFWYDEQSPYELSRGNLVRHRSRAPAGGVSRTYDFEYNLLFNLVNLVVGPRGLADGENRGAYATSFTHDAKGRIVKITHPRTLHAVIQPVGSGRKLIWIDDNPTDEFTYNDYGLPKEHTDREGVVTEFRYWPATDPFALNPPLIPGMGASTDAPGLLAFVLRDTRDTPDRQLYLPGVAVNTSTSIRAYNAIGDLLFTKDTLQKETKIYANALHQVYKVEEDPLALTPVTREQLFDDYGNLASISLKEPASKTSPAGTITQRTFFNRAKRTWEQHLIFQPDPPAPGAPLPPAVERIDTLQVDEDDMPTTYKDADAHSGTTASLEFAADERGMTARVSNAASGTLRTGVHTTAGGEIDKVEFAGNRTSQGLSNSMGEAAGVVTQDGLRTDTLHDAGGSGTRNVERAPIAGSQPPRTRTTGFRETKVDEWKRDRRTNDGYFDPSDPNTAKAASAPEYFPDAGQPWPPEAGATALADGAWGPGDGRITSDVLFSAGGRVVRDATDHLGMSWTRYDAHGRPVEWSDSRDDFDPYYNLTAAEYDWAKRSVKRTHTLHSSDKQHPRTVSFVEQDELDIFGRVARRIDGAGGAVRMRYNMRGQLVELYDEVGRDTTETFNGAAVNGPGNAHLFELDEAGRVVRIEIPLTRNGIGGDPPEVNPFNASANVKMTYSYDGAGRFNGHVNWAGGLTLRKYDSYGRLEKIVYEASAASAGVPVEHVQTYDAQSRLETTTDGNRTRIRLDYDAANRIKSRRVETPSGLPGSQQLDCEYDDSGFLRTAQDLTSGYKTTFTYDTHGNVLTANENGLSIVSKYKGARHRQTLTYPSGGDVTFEYDVNGRLRSVDDRGAKLGIEYLGDALVDSYTFGKVRATHDYDNAGRLKVIAVNGVGGGSLTFTVRFRDGAGRITERKRELGTASEARSYFYDSAGRLVRDRAQPLPGSGAASTTVTIWLDGDGVARKRETAHTGAGAPAGSTEECEREERGRVIKRNNVTLKYDLNGNLLDDGTRQYVYDPFDRLIEVRQGAAPLCSYVYDVLHRLVKRTAGAVSQTFVYDGANIIEIGTGHKTDRFVYADDAPDLLLAEIGGTRYLVITSPEGSTDTLVDAQGNIAESYEYSCKGAPIRLNAARQKLAGTPLCPFLHKQRLYDDVAGLSYYNLRWYSPELAVFLTADPAGIAEGTNSYVLCQNDAINRSDETGAQTSDSDMASDAWSTLKNVPATWSWKRWDPMAGLEAAYGAGKAVVTGTVQLGLMAWDTGTHVGAAMGGYRFKSVSQLGKLYDSSPTLGDFFFQAGKGIVMTPVRMIDAGAKGNAVSFGEEAMNLYMMVRPQAGTYLADVALARYTRFFNRGVGALRAVQGGGRLARAGRFVATTIRKAQVQMVRGQAMLALLRSGRNPLRILGTEWTYGESSAGKSFGRYSRGETVTTPAGSRSTSPLVTIFEEAFNPPPNWQATIDPRIAQALGPELFAEMLRQGITPRGSGIHEGFHAYQDAVAPEWYGEGLLQSQFDYAHAPTEFTMPGQPLPGAFTFQIANPVTPSWKFGLVATPLYIGSRNRR